LSMAMAQPCKRPACLRRRCRCLCCSTPTHSLTHPLTYLLTHFFLQGASHQGVDGCCQSRCGSTQAPSTGNTGDSHQDTRWALRETAGGGRGGDEHASCTCTLLAWLKERCTAAVGAVCYTYVWLYVCISSSLTPLAAFPSACSVSMRC